jgi:hypothetical protein
MWVATNDLPRSATHPFYMRLNQILEEHHFDGHVEGLCQQFYADEGRPGLPPGRYFRLLLIGYFEGLGRIPPMFHTQSEARRFFVDRIIQQAETEHVKLSEDEREMLLWSESAPDSVADPELVGRLEAEISDADYESKIAGLVQRSFAADVAVDHQTKQRWRQAWTVLNHGDHYILVMINAAVGKHVKPWWRFW